MKILGSEQTGSGHFWPWRRPRLLPISSARAIFCLAGLQEALSFEKLNPLLPFVMRAIWATVCLMARLSNQPILPQGIRALPEITGLGHFLISLHPHQAVDWSSLPWPATELPQRTPLSGPPSRRDIKSPRHCNLGAPKCQKVL